MNRIFSHLMLLPLCLIVLVGFSPAPGQAMVVIISTVGPSNNAGGYTTPLVQPGSTVYLSIDFTVTGGQGQVTMTIKVVDLNGLNVIAWNKEDNVQVNNGPSIYNPSIDIPVDTAPGKYTMTGTIKQGTRVLAESTGDFFIQGGAGHLGITKLDVGLTKDGPAVRTCSPGDTVFWRTNYTLSRIASGDKDLVGFLVVGPDGIYIPGLITGQVLASANGARAVVSQKTIPADAKLGVYTLWGLVSLSGSVSDTQACLGEFEVVPKGQKKTLSNLPRAVPSPSSNPNSDWIDQRLYGGHINSIAVEPTKGSLLFAGTSNGVGLFKSTDGGKTWQPVPAFRTSNSQTIEYSNQDPNTIWIGTQRDIFKSFDGGKTFPKYSSGYGLAQYSFSRHPANPDVAYVGTAGLNDNFAAGLVLMTVNGGKSWVVLNQQFDRAVTSLAINRQNPSEIWAGTGRVDLADGKGSLYKSSDGGKIWSQVAVGSAGSFENLAIRPDNPKVVLTGGPGGLFRTTDGGATWKRLAPPSTYRGLILDPSNPAMVYVGRAAEDNNAVLSSADGGDSWEEAPIGDLSPNTLACNPRYPSIVYLGDLKLGIHISRDRGDTFSFSSEGILANVTSFLAKDATSAGDLLVATISGIYRRGKDHSWQNLNKKAAAQCLVQDPATPNTIYLGCEGSLV
ncbi:MAG: hypothetical protein HQK58_17575, partial [Deltaproteobacteria bacterium]|nr:hypothetical protein [Deltaproteobacteria bacterium]